MSHEQCPNLCKFSEEVTADITDVGAPDWDALLEFIMELISMITQNCPAKASDVVKQARKPERFQRVKTRVLAWRMAKGNPVLQSNARKCADCCIEHAGDPSCCTDEELAGIVSEARNDNWIAI